ncbi:hypothetical protein [Bordetella phage vB_BbrS_PHB09]|nr:hypothetical protein [Bordetella phage vB_BbrS_PHB09]
MPMAKLEGISLIDHLWNRLSGTYGGRWNKDFPDMQSIENWKGAWAEAFDEDGLTPQEAAEGFRACRRLYDWPPSVTEFIKACRPYLIPENAFHDAVVGMTARQRGEIGNWRHPAVYWAAVRVGRHDLLHCGYSVMQQRWERALADELALGAWDEVPAPSIALPAPGATQATREEAEQALRSMGAQAIGNGGKGDPRRGWRRVLAEMKDPKGRRYSPAVVAMARNALGLSEGSEA